MIENKSKRKVRMSRQYPFVIFAEILFLCDDVANSDVLYYNGKPITFNKMSKVLKIKRRWFNELFKILKMYNLCDMVIKKDKKQVKKYIKIHKRVKYVIRKANIIKDGKVN